MNNYSIIFWKYDFLFCLNEFYLIFFILALLIFNLSYNNLIEKKQVRLLNLNLIFCFCSAIINCWFSLENLDFFNYYILFNENLDLITHHFLKKSIFDNQFLISKISEIYKLIIFFSVALFFLISYYYVYIKNWKTYEYTILLLFTILGISLLIMSNNFLSFYVSLELQSLCLYILACFNRNNIFSIESALKYFILGAISSCFFLYGISLCYGFLGSINFSELHLIFHCLFDSEFKNEINLFHPIYLSLTFLLAGLLFKLGIAPFHLWVVDVYQGAPFIITLFFTILPKIVFINLFFKFSINLFFLVFNLNYLFLILGTFSIFIGTFSALKQVKVKRIFAFSSISHAGFLILGLAPFNFFSLICVTQYLLIYILLSFSIFTLFLTLRYNENQLMIKHINDLTNFSFNNPSISILLAISLFSLAGIPPLAGFFGKFFIVYNLLEQGFFFFSILAIIFSVISSYFYIKLIYLMFFFSKNEKNFIFNNLNFSKKNLLIKKEKKISLILTFLFFFNILYIYFPFLILNQLYLIFDNTILINFQTLYSLSY